MNDLKQDLTISAQGYEKIQNKEAFNDMLESVIELIATLGYKILTAENGEFTTNLLKYYSKHNGKWSTVYLKNRADIDKNKEQLEKADSYFFGGEDVIRRNLLLLENSNKVLTLTSGLASLSDIHFAIEHFKVPVIYYNDGSEKSQEFIKLLKQEKDLEGKIAIISSIEDLRQELQ